MNIWQKILARYGAQYVFLINIYGDRHVRRAREIGGSIYARMYSNLPETERKLLPGGKVENKLQYHTEEWEPITSKTHALFQALTYEDAIKKSDKAELIQNEWDSP